jgi:sulfur-carrier protein
LVFDAGSAIIKTMITVLYFARLREALGTASERVELTGDARSLDALRALLVARGGAWAQELAPGRPVRAAVNQAMVHGDAPLTDGDEVAFFPPVTGG